MAVSQACDLPAVPVLVNEEKIKKHTMLIATHDGELKTIQDNAQKKRAADLQSEKKAADDKASAKKKAKT